MTAWHDPGLAEMTLEALLERLSQKDDVEGLIMIGSHGTDRFSVASDYDLILVLRSGVPSFETVTTWVDGHLTEINCKTIDELEALASLISVRDISSTGALVNQIRAGRLIFDRSGRVSKLRRRLLDLPAPAPIGPDEAYDWWVRVG